MYLMAFYDRWKRFLPLITGEYEKKHKYVTMDFFHQKPVVSEMRTGAISEDPGETI
jgi:hypothetical protein